MDVIETLVESPYGEKRCNRQTTRENKNTENHPSSGYLRLTCNFRSLRRRIWLHVWEKFLCFLFWNFVWSENFTFRNRLFDDLSFPSFNRFAFFIPTHNDSHQVKWNEGETFIASEAGLLAETLEQFKKCLKSENLFVLYDYN